MASSNGFIIQVIYKKAYRIIFSVFDKMSTKVIAFSGIWNTWKTTIIWKLSEDFSLMWFKVKVFDEIARSLYHILESEWLYKFQIAINDWEINRLEEIKKTIKEWIYDIVLIDRTTIDNRAFYEINKMTYWRNNWDSFSRYHENIYDLVIFFNSQIKSTENQHFLQYNNSQLDILLESVLLEHYIVLIRGNGMMDYNTTKQDILNLLP